MANHILIGIGGTGYKVLREFRKRLWAEEPDLVKRQKLPIRFLYVDSDEETKPEKLMGNEDLRVNGQDTAITPDEYLNIKNVDLNSVFANLSGYPNLRHIIGNGEFIKSCLGEVGAAAGQKRRAGRILFAANAREYLSKVKNLIADLQHTIGNANDLRIYLFTGLAGGTGSGAIIDAIAQLIADETLANSKIEVFAMLPEQLPPIGADAGRYHANGHAALKELSALNVGVFLPADVVKGTEHINLRNTIDMKQFGLTVYTNVNRNGAVVDSYTTLPSLVADVLYFRILSPLNESIYKLNKYFISENRPNFLVEYKTNTREGNSPERARTKAVGSFGIKRVRYPDDRLMSHSSETIARNILEIISYLNYDNDAGFINEAPKTSKDYSEYLNRANLKNWKLSDADLSLSVPILPPVGGRMPETFDKFWEEVSLDYDHNTAKSMGHPLQILDQYFEERFKGERPEDSFREEKGVEAYFSNKASEQVITDSVASIINKIRKSLFSQWQQGIYSAYDVRQITEQILHLLQDKNKSFEEQLIKLEDLINSCKAERDLLREEYKNIGIINNWLRRTKENIFLQYSQELAKEYSARTLMTSMTVFQRRLLPKLIQQFVNLQAEIQTFVGSLQDSIKEYSMLIGTNTPAADPDLRANMIEVGDISRLNKFESSLLHDRAKMETMAQKFRDRISVNATSSFEKISKSLRNIRKLDEIAKSSLGDLIKTYHNEMLQNKPVLGLNVLQQLYHMYGDSEDAIGRFATAIVRNSEVFINLNDQEINRMMRNTENPNSTQAAGPNTIMLVAIPNIKTDDVELQQFVETLRIKLRQAFNTSETRDFVLMESPRADEITVISYQNLFPIRAIDYMPFLKGKYDTLIDSNNETTNISNKVLLHSEGDGSSLPPLFGEGEGPKGDDIIKYIFLGTALNLFKQGEDEYGNIGWGTVITDEFGVEMFTLLAEKFTGLLSSPELTPELISEISEKIDKLIVIPRHVNEKSKMAQIIKDLMKNVVLPESGSPNGEQYKRYAAQAKNALQKLN